MPTASEQVRKPWHYRKDWVKIGPDVDRKSLGAVAIIGNYALLPTMDGGALRYLERRGYVEHRGMIYAPKKKAEIDAWRPSEKEASAIRYLVDEWDYSFDLRRHGDVLKTHRKTMSDHVLNWNQGTLEERVRQAMNQHRALAEALAK